MNTSTTKASIKPGGAQPGHGDDVAEIDLEGIASKTRSYEYFLNEVLREDLKIILSRRDELYQKVAEYMEQELIFEKVISITSTNEEKEPLVTKVDIGCNFYVQGEMPTPIKTVIMDIGCGIFLTMSIQEGLLHCKQMIQYLNKRIETLTKQELETKAKINVTLRGLQELQQLPNARPPEESEPAFPRFD